MPHPHLDDSTLRGFLLGEVSDEERERIELLLLEDDELFERCEAIEAEVLADHVKGRLDARQRNRVTALMLASPEIESRQALLRNLLSVAQAERLRHFSYGAIAATVLLAFGLFGWALHRKPTPPPVEARTLAPPVAPKESTTHKIAQTSDTQPGAEPSHSGGGTSPGKWRGGVATATQVVVIGLSSVRGEGDLQQYSVDRAKDKLILRFLFGESSEAETYDIHLADSTGQEIQTRLAVKPIRSKRGDALIVALSTAELPAGAYSVTLDPIPPEAGGRIVKDFEITDRHR